MRRIGVFLILISLFIPASLWATPITDLQIMAPDGWTAPFAKIVGNDNVISYFEVSDENSNGVLDRGDIKVGTNYHDFGHFKANSLTTFLGGNIDEQDMNTDWELTIYWEDLQGTITEVTSDYIKGSYLAGTFVVYLDTSPNYDAGTYGSPYDYWDGTAVKIDTDSGYADGTKIMELSVIGGEAIAPFSRYSNRTYRNTTLVGQVTYVDTSYIQSGTYDLGTLVQLDWMIGIATESASVDNLYWLDNTTDYPISSNLAGYDFSSGAIAQYGGGTATIRFEAVPEPASILLLGGGLFVIGVIGRKRLSK